MNGRVGTVLHIAPHPDDELLGAPATLLSLRDLGWRVVNLACGLGRPPHTERRRAELIEACRRARFELVIPSDLPLIGRDDDLERAQHVLAEEIGSHLQSLRAAVIVGPSREDGHHGHEVVGRAIEEAVEAYETAAERHEAAAERDEMAAERDDAPAERDPATAELDEAPAERDPATIPTPRSPVRVMFWGLWRDLARPNLLVPFDAPRLEEIQHALAAHAGELKRNRFQHLLEGRATAQAVLGPERVFGYGSRGIAEPFAELLLDVTFSPGRGWRPEPPRVFDPQAPLG